MANLGARVISIGSLSEYLIEKSEYGKSKSAATKFVLDGNGTVLTCGLIHGHDYKGQLFQIAQILAWLPFLPQFNSRAEQFTTSLDLLLEAIDLIIQDSLTGNHFLVVDAQTPRLFNSILRELSPKRRLKIKIPIALMYVGAFLMEEMKINYFNRDSLKGLLGSYDYSRIRQLARLDNLAD